MAPTRRTGGSEQVMNSTSRIQQCMRGALVFLAVAMLSLLTGSCMTMRESARKEQQVELKRGYKFSHEVHKTAGLDDCSACHDPAAGNAAALSMPGHDLCSVCHEIPESNFDPPPDPAAQEQCMFCHTRADYAVKPWQKKLGGDLKWQHAAHTAAEIACDTCHTTLDSGAFPPAPAKAFCMDCHGKTSPELNACSVCHETMTMDAIPEFRYGQRIAHDAPDIWRKIHGQESQVDAQYCAQCHETQNRCDDCHSVMPPDNHTIAFKHRTHGMIAQWDRKSCAACHEEQTCSTCHNETKPASHHGGWGGIQNTHCVNCHNAPERNGCAVCHEDVEHETAGFSPHSLGIYPPNCAQCHPGGLPHQAPHLLNSTAHCSECHK